MLTAKARARDFPGLEQRVYLNTAAEGIPPACVREALQDYWRDKLQGMKGRDAHFARMEAVYNRRRLYCGTNSRTTRV